MKELADILNGWLPIESYDFNTEHQLVLVCEEWGDISTAKYMNGEWKLFSDGDLVLDYDNRSVAVTPKFWRPLPPKIDWIAYGEYVAAQQ
jgi:hypothetical protein